MKPKTHKKRAELDHGPTWGVVMTVNEPSALVISNAAWHISTGAQEVHLYFDRPNDPVLQTVAAIQQVRVVECNEEYWSRANVKRPHSQTRRQFINANDALKHCSVDWLAHIDADEFLLQNSPIQRELKSIQEIGAALHFDVRERVYFHNSSACSIFDGAFRSRSQMPAALDRSIFGELNRYLQRGLLSHCAGKTAVPTNQDFLLGVHSAYKGRRSGESRAASFKSKSTVLLHFDGMTPLHWIAKLLRYARTTQQHGTSMFSKSRQCQIAECLKSIGSHESALAFHDKLRLLNHAQKLRHANFDLLHTEGFNPLTAILSVTSRHVDLSPAAFDVEFLAREPEIPTSIVTLCSSPFTGNEDGERL
jgi:Glycosyl transferase family 2